MKIGQLKLKSKALAAPMAGYTDYSWRMIAVECGAALVFSEMVPVEGLKRARNRTLEYVKNSDAAKPFSVQLYGSKAESFADAVDILAPYKFDAIDINMGCPVKKVTARGEGAALMKEPGRVKEIIKAVRTKYAGPLTVKFRSGWDDDTKNALEIARIAEDSGADAVIVHPRTRMQAFTGHADWAVIARVKDAVNIPVIGNGDVVDKKSADEMFKVTGCDAIMIGRASLGNPWLFSEINGAPPLDLKARFKILYRHIALVSEREDERHVIHVMRKFILKYLKGIHGNRELAKLINSTIKADVALDGIKAFEKVAEDGDRDPDHVGQTSV